MVHKCSILIYALAGTLIPEQLPCSGLRFIHEGTSYLKSTATLLVFWLQTDKDQVFPTSLLKGYRNFRLPKLEVQKMNMALKNPQELRHLVTA